MEGGIVLGEGKTLAFDGFGDDHRRPADNLFRLFQRFENLADVVAVDLQDLPAEGFPFPGNIRDVQDLPVGPVAWRWL